MLARWRALLVEQFDIAVGTGKLPGRRPHQLTFRLLAYVLEANWAA
jgi:hypothetical protein